MTSDSIATREADRDGGLAAALYRAVVDTAVDAIIVIDRLGTMLSANKAVERMFGYAAGELIGRNVKMLMPEPYSGEHDGYLANYDRTGEKKIIGIGREVVGRRKDGSVFPMELAVGETLQGDAPIFVGIIRDIAERKAAELALRERELRLRSILDTVPDAIIVIDTRGLIHSFSPAAERLFGYEPHEAVGQNASMLMPSSYGEDHGAYLARYLTTGEGRIAVGVRKDGDTFPLELSVGEFRLGDETFLTGFVRDLTERERTEKHVQDLQSELLHVSRLSTMGQMASTLAHELNQPLTAVTNYLQAVRRLLAGPAVDAGRIDEIVEKAVAQAARAGQVIRRLREFVAKGEVDRGSEDLNQVVEEAVALALVGATQHRVRVAMHLDHRLVPVLIDKVQIQQVVLNLVRNAVEAMQLSEPRELVVSTAARQGGGAEIRIADTGPGLADEIAARLFEPFLTTKESGMGLGLSICREIVEAHGGRIAAAPNVPNGTVFTVALPSAPREDPGDAS